MREYHRTRDDGCEGWLREMDVNSKKRLYGREYRSGEAQPFGRLRALNF